MMIQSQAPAQRIRKLNDCPVVAQGKWVVYWMTAFRRVRYNFALQVARDLALQLERPLVILEALRVRYPWAADRFHRFIIEGMRDNAAECKTSGALYYPYVEPTVGTGSGLMRELAASACAVVTDDYPGFFHPRMHQAASKSLSVQLVAVDSNGLLPLAATDRTFTVAHSYRRFMQRELPRHLEDFPEANPLERRATRRLKPLRALPEEFERRWPPAEIDALLASHGLRSLRIDHAVGPTPISGGWRSADRLLNRFVEQRLLQYAQQRNKPDESGSSELSAHLHFGHISAHEVFARVAASERWHPGRLGKPNGKAEGFWGVRTGADAFLDQLCTWREIGFNMSWREPNYTRYESLPHWALKTLHEHATDERPHLYRLDEFEGALTHDEIWNATQRQLVRDGRIHNYLRMLWGKKILHWSRSPQEALAIMIQLNNKYALDGRDPNSYSGIFWILGRYDRAWGPERAVFGKIRYMSTASAAKKYRLQNYLKIYAEF